MVTVRMKLKVTHVMTDVFMVHMHLHMLTVTHMYTDIYNDTYANW